MADETVVSFHPDLSAKTLLARSSPPIEDGQTLKKYVTMAGFGYINSAAANHHFICLKKVDASLKDLQDEEIKDQTDLYKHIVFMNEWENFLRDSVSVTNFFRIEIKDKLYYLVKFLTKRGHRTIFNGKRFNFRHKVVLSDINVSERYYNLLQRDIGLAE